MLARPVARLLTVGLLAAVTALSLSACSGSSSGDGSNPTVATGEIGQAITVDGAALTVTKAETTAPRNAKMPPPAGRALYAVTFKLENAGQDPAPYDISPWAVQDAAGGQNRSQYVASLSGNLSNSGTLDPGTSLAGTIVYEVPKDLKSLKLLVPPSVTRKGSVLITLTK